ncbi:MAG: hypothetical protein GY765_38555 [bacterium]|nr:hypothetical protein [bacterium]
MNYCKILIVLAIVFFGVTLFAHAQEEPFRFPVKPGSEAWKNFTSHSGMLEAIQIPVERLERMSTATLVQTCLNYPLYLDLIAYNTLQEGIEAVISDFNGLRELLRRKDAAEVLFRHYEKIQPGAFNADGPDVTKGAYSTKQMYMEMLLAQDAMLNKLAAKERHYLLVESTKHIEAKLECPELYGLISLKTSALLMGRVLLRAENREFSRRAVNDEELKGFLNNALLKDPGLIYDIVSEAKRTEYLEK